MKQDLTKLILQKIKTALKLVKFSDTIPVHWFLITGLFLCLKQPLFLLIFH